MPTVHCKIHVHWSQGEHSKFIYVILWKILLTSSETNGYKITGHDNNFIAGILLMKTLGTLKTRLLATLFDTKPVLWTLSLMIFYTATIAAFVQHLTTFYKPSCGSLVGYNSNFGLRSCTLYDSRYCPACTREPKLPCLFWKVLRWWESSPVDQCYQSEHVYSKSVPMPTLMKLIFLFVFIPIQSTCICVPRMDIKFSFHTMKWWITQENLLK